MTKNKRRKRKIATEMKNTGANYTRARNAVLRKAEAEPHLEHNPVAGLIEFLKENDDFGLGRDAEIDVIDHLLKYAHREGILNATIRPHKGGGIALKWNLKGGGQVTIEVEAKSGVSLYRFGPSSKDTVILYGMDYGGDDTLKVHRLMQEHLKGGTVTEREDGPLDDEAIDDEEDTSALEDALRATFPSLAESASKPEPSEWELRLQSLADAHTENIMIEPVSESAQKLTRYLLSNAERLGIKIPEIDALKGGGIELFWREGEREIGVEIDAKGYSVLWDGVIGDRDDYFESKPVGLPHEIQRLIEAHAPINLIEGYTFRQWNGAYSHEPKSGKSLLS